MKKKLLSILLTVCMVLSLLPTAALAVETVTVNDLAALKAALSSAADGDTIAVGADITVPSSIVISKNVTLDLAGHTLTYAPPSGSICLRFSAGGTITDSVGGGGITGAAANSLLLHNAGGTLTVAGGAIQATGGQGRAVQNDGTLHITGGTVQADTGFAVLNNGIADVTGGVVETATGVGVLNYSSAARLTLSGGTVRTTSTTEPNTFGAFNKAAGAEITVEDGSTVTSGSGCALGNLNGGTITVDGGNITAVSGNTILNDGDSTTAVHGGSVTSQSGCALMNYGNLLVDGGNALSEAGLALNNLAKGGTEVTLSGGSLVSNGYTAINNQGSGDLHLLGSTVSSPSGGTSPAVVNFTTGTITVESGAITAGSSVPTFYNVSTGSFVISGGTYNGVYNANAGGKVQIDGGSIQKVSGATPVNSAGVDLQEYAIKLTGVAANTPVSGDELTFSPAVSYGFTDVRTDANSYLYLWLPAGITSATYKTDKVDIAGSVTGGSESTLPNANFTVSVYLDGKLWTDCPAAFRPILRPENGGLSTYPGPSDTGVFSYAGMDGTTTYQIWGKAVLGQAAFEGVTIGNGTASASVYYYTLTMNSGSGISFMYPGGTTQVMKGAKISFTCTPEDGLTFEKWTDAAGTTVSTEKNFDITIDGTKNYTYTATAKIVPLTATVTVQKDNKTWTEDYLGAITLSTDKNNIETGKATGALDKGVTTFENLDPTKTYYVWVDGASTGQTVNTNSPNAAVDYYTVTLTKGNNINTVTGSATVLKGGSTNITATAADGDFVFSRWNQTETGALYSTTAETTVSNITSPVTLTAVGASTKYTATVTVKKDDEAWTAETRGIKLSTSQTTETGTVTATPAGFVYTFSGLNGATTYYIWDTVTGTYTGQYVSAGDTTANVTLDYYSVNVTNNGGANLTVTGGGTYLKGSTVTVTASPAQYYRAKWSDNATAAGKTIKDISAQTDLTVTAELATYTGAVTLKLDSDGKYTKQTVTLKADGENAVDTTESSGVYSSNTQLDPTKTYKVLVDGTDTGATLTGSMNSAAVQYYTVSVTAEGVGTLATQYVQSGKNAAAFTAVPNSGFDFIGWYDASEKLLSTTPTLTLTGVTAQTALTARASDKFDAVITVNGASDRTITLKSGSDDAINPTEGTTFKALDRTKTYKVLDTGADTGFTISKNAPNATLQYYSVKLTGTDAGVNSVTGDGTYLTGTSVTIHANIKEGSVFGSWMESGGTILSTQKSCTISSIGKNYDLTAKTALSFNGTVDITRGNIVIEDDVKDETHVGHAGKIRITVDGAVPTNGDNLDPNTNINITGGTTDSPATNNITVTTQYNVMVTLDNVHISSASSPLDMKGTDSSTLTLDWVRTNTLSCTGDNSAGLHKSGNSKLVLQGSDDSAKLTVTGGMRAAGIGGNYNEAATNITINSGIIVAVGGVFGAGIGGGIDCSANNLVINGGTITSTTSASNSNTCGIGAGCHNNIGTGGNIEINGGTIIATGGSGGPGIGVFMNGTIAINGGTMSSTSANPVVACSFGGATIKINGGNIIGSVKPHTDNNTTIPKNAKGEFVYKTTFSTGASAVTDVSKTLTIRDKNGTVYGMKDVKTDANGKVYAYLAEDTAGATYDGGDYAANVKTDGTGVFTKIVVDSTAYTVDIPASATTEGITAAGTLQQIIPQYAAGVTVTVNVTLSGTSLKSGTYTVGLSGTSAETISAPVTVTQHIDVERNPANTVYTFTFPMPAQAVCDLAVTLTFNEDNKYTVTYAAPDATGGTVPAGGSYYDKQKYTVAGNTGNLVRTGYAFNGWDKSGEQTMGTANVIHTAQWTASPYTVTFHANGGTGSNTTQSFTYGTAQALTANSFTQDGYSFAGWATSADGSKVYNNKDSVTVVQDTDLYALWTKDSYTVTFDGNGASGSIAAQTVPNNAPSALTVNVFTRTGYTFAGWNTTADGKGTTYADGASITTADNVKLYAQWTAYHYKVAFHGNGATSDSMTSQDFTYGAAAAALNANGFTRTGYTFAGWNTKSDGAGNAYTDKQSVQNLTADKDGTVTLYARWTANTYKVTFDGNGSTAGIMTAQDFVYDAVSAPLTASAFTRSGYVFAGWNTAPEGTGNAYADKTPVKNLTADKDGTVTLYAQWATSSFTVKFDGNSGVGGMKDQTFQTGNTTALKTNAFTRMGYTFVEWNTKANGTGDIYGAQARVDSLNLGAGSSITLYAQWNANSYTVKFNANGGTGSMSSQPLTYDAAEAALTVNAFTRAGYNFLGWAESPASTHGEYADGQPVRNLTPMSGGVITLYAVWKANTVPVVFDGNGAGSGSMVPQTFTYHTAQPLSQNTFQRAGYDFAGWNTQANGRGVSYRDEQSVTDPIPDITGSLTLYAQWQQQSRYGLAGLVSTDSNPAVPIPNATITIRQGNTVLSVTKTDENGQYSFTNLRPGSYNVVCAYDGKTVTKAAAVIDGPVDVPFSLSSTAKNSLLVLGNDSGVTVPTLVVDGLSGVADAQAQPSAVTTVKLTVTAKAPNEVSGEQAAIQELAKNQTVGLYLDAQLTCNGTSIGASNNTVLEILIPYDFSSKTDLKVLRWHDGAASELKELNSRPTSGFADGTWFKDVTGGQIIVYASKFSTYAVSYSAVSSNGGSGGSGGSGSSSSYPIVVDENSAVHGQLLADKNAAPAGAKLTISAKPDSGYRLHHLTITDADGKAILYTDEGNGTYTFVMPNSKATVSAEFVRQSKNPFIDVADNAYYYDAVLWAVEKGVTNGTSANTFSPDLTCTRAQTVAFLWRALGSPEPTAASCPFTDVAKNAYYYKAVLWATEKGITKGTTDSTFSPNMTVTRGQTMTFLWRTAGNPSAGATNPFADVKADAYYADAVLWAVKESITSGTSATSFAPADGCSRAQTVTFLYRYLK